MINNNRSQTCVFAFFVFHILFFVYLRTKIEKLQGLAWEKLWTKFGKSLSNWGKTITRKQVSYKLENISLFYQGVATEDCFLFFVYSFLSIIKALPKRQNIACQTFLLVKNVCNWLSQQNVYNFAMPWNFTVQHFCLKMFFNIFNVWTFVYIILGKEWKWDKIIHKTSFIGRNLCLLQRTVFSFIEVFRQGS